MATTVDQPRRLLLDSLQRVGYGQGHVELDWPYLNLAALGEHKADRNAGRLDIAAFNDERRHDWETSAVICDLQSPDLLASAEAGRQGCRMLFDATAAPNVLFGGSDTVDLWLRCETSSPRRIAGVGFNAGALRRAFADNRDALERESLSRLRVGQRYLFDRVYDARRDQLAEFIHIGLEQAIRTFRRTVGTSIPKSERDDLELSLSHVAMALLAARIMEDKDFFGEQDRPSSNARNLIERAESASNGFFQHVMRNDLSELDNQLGRRGVNDLLSYIMAYLTGPACFSLITPDMLGDLYERALVANNRVGRRVDIKGIHYTPLTISQHILRRIPIEEIPPSKRCILDPACGSGSFLMAATARLRDAFDANESDAEDDVLRHLRSRVIGNDVDNIARLVTRMRYLLHHWIETGSPDDVPTPKLLESDGLNLKAADFEGVQPSVIVGNPPFNPVSLAADFLSASIRLVAPNGFLGMIMPASFLRKRRDQCPEARRMLLNHCELLEVWEMPQGTVGTSARHSPCAIVARKKEGRSGSASAIFKLGHSAQADAVAANRDHLRATWAYAADRLSGTDVSWIDDPCRSGKRSDRSMSRIIASPIDNVLRKIATDLTLAHLCGRNMVLGIHGRGGGTERASTDEQGFEPYLQHQSRIRPFFLTEDDWQKDPKSAGSYVNPTTAHRPKERFWPLYRGPKIVVSGRTNRNTFVQASAAYDEHGVFPEDDIRCLALADRRIDIQELPRKFVEESDRTLLLWLTAILNSAIGQAWIAIGSTPRGMTDEVLETFPIPMDCDLRIIQLVESTSALERPDRTDSCPVWPQWSNRRASRPGADFATIAGQLNCLVFRSYGLSQDDFVQVTRYLESMTNPWVNGSADAHIVTHRA